MELELEQAKLYFETQGDKSNPPLVLWHGAGCTLRMWDYVVEELKKDFFTIAFDIRGSGSSVNSDTKTDSFSFERYSQDLNSILDYLSIERAHMWSMAWGTRAAIAYSSLFSNKVISAVFSDASIGEADVEEQKLGLKRALEKQVESGIDRYPLPKDWNVHLNKESAASSLGAVAKFDLSSALDGISFPFLVMTGDHDPNLSSSKDIANSSSAGQLRILKNVGHGSILQRPDLTLDNFLDWHTQNKNKYA